MSIIYFGVAVVLFSFILSLGRFLNCLMILENLNVLLLFGALCILPYDTRMFFVCLAVIFTLEVTLSLLVITRFSNHSNGLLDVTSE